MLKMLRHGTSLLLTLVLVITTMPPFVYAFEVQNQQAVTQQNVHNSHHCHDASSVEQKTSKQCPTRKSGCGESICHCGVRNCQSVFLTPLLNLPSFPSIFTRLYPFNAEKLPSKIVNTIERPPKQSFIVA